MADAGGHPVRQPGLVHVGRQPILDRSGRLYGYELLFRGTTQASSSGVTGPGSEADAATTQTILSAFAEFGVQLLGGGLGFVNLTRAFIVGHLPVPFEPQAAGLELLESVEIDDEVVAGARRRAEEGYLLALDDFVWSPQAAPLLELAGIVKLDVLEPEWDEVLRTIELCRPYGVRFLAERVEDEAMLRRAADAGFELFQGYHLGRPQTLTMESLGPGQAVALRLLSQLADPATTARDVEQVLRTDPALSIQLLKIANAASSGLTRRLSSIRDAVVLVGMAKLRAWMMLIALADSGSGSGHRINTALVRARICELITPAISPQACPDAAFTLGLLHGFAEAVRLDPVGLGEGLPALADDLRSALAGEPGPLRKVLDCVLCYESGDPAAMVANCPLADRLAGAYVQALAWTTATVSRGPDPSQG
ncbi:MAG TPA: HDOD domain-containing protein [Kineosporiaceae bacterium]|nr:HDOD domain-containing protein [Kineosporiaceae bacterium]